MRVRMMSWKVGKWRFCCRDCDMVSLCRDRTVEHVKRGRAAGREARQRGKAKRQSSKRVSGQRGLELSNPEWSRLVAAEDALKREDLKERRADESEVRLRA